MPAKRSDAIDIKTRYDGRGVNEAKTGIKSLSKANKEVADRQKLNQITAEQAAASIKKAANATRESTEKATEQIKKANNQIKEFKDTKLGKFVKQLVIVIEKIALIINYVTTAILVVNLLIVAIRKANNGIRNAILSGAGHSGDLLHALGMVLGAVIDIIAKTKMWKNAFVDSIKAANAVRNIAGKMKDIGYVTKKVVDTVKSFGKILVNAFRKNPVTGTLNIFTHLGNIVKNVGDVVIKAGEKFKVFGEKGTVVGAVVSKIGLGIKSLAQSISKGIKINSFETFLDFLKKVGSSLMSLGAFKQILKDINNIPFLKPLLGSLSQSGSLLSRFTNSLKLISETPFGKAVGEKFKQISESVQALGSKLVNSFNTAKDPMGKLSAVAGTLFTELKGGFNSVSAKVIEFFNKFKSGAGNTFNDAKEKVMGFFNQFKQKATDTSSFAKFSDAIRNGFGKIGNYFNIGKTEAKDFTNFLNTSGYFGTRAFLQTIEKANQVTALTFLKATANAKLAHASSEQLSVVVEKVRGGFDKLRSKSKVFDNIAGSIGKATKGFRNAFQAALKFSKIGSFMSAAVGAVKNFLGIQKKVPKSFKDQFLQMTQVFRYGVFMFRTLGRHAKQLIGGSLEAASKFGAISNKFNVVFGEFSNSTQKWVSDFAFATNANEQSLVKWMSTFQDTFVPLGFAREEGSKLSRKLAELSSHVAKFNGLKTDEVMQAFSSAITGSHETVKKFGIIINEITMREELLKMGIEGGTQAANEQEKAIARLNIMMNSSKDAWGAAYDRAFDYNSLLEGISGTVSKMKVTLGNSMKGMASAVLAGVKQSLDVISEIFDKNKEGVEKVFNQIGTAINKAIKNIMNAVKKINLSQIGNLIEGIITFFGKIAAAAMEVFAAITPGINNTLGMLGNMLRFLGQIDLKFVMIAFSIFMMIKGAMQIYNMVTTLLGLYKMAKSAIVAIKGLTAATSIMNAVMNASPALLIGVALAAVAAAVVGIGIASSKAKDETKKLNSELSEMAKKQKELKDARAFEQEVEKLKLMSEEQLLIVLKQITDQKLGQYLQEKNLVMGIATARKMINKLEKEHTAGAVKEIARLKGLIREWKSGFIVPQTSSEALNLFGDQDLMYATLKILEELRSKTKDLVKAQDELTSYEWWGYESDLIESVVSKSKELLYLGSLQKQINVSLNYGLKERAEILSKITQKVFDNKDIDSVHNDVLDTQKGLMAQIYYNAQETAALTGKTYEFTKDIKNVEGWVVANSNKRVEELLKIRQEYETQLKNVRTTLEMWESIVKTIKDGKLSARDFAKEVREGVEKNTKSLLDNVISADIWRQTAKPKWGDILAIDDLEEKKDVLSEILSKVELDWFTRQDSDAINYENFEAIENFASAVRKELEKTNAELKKQEEEVDKNKGAWDEFNNKVIDDMRRERDLQKALLRAQAERVGILISSPGDEKRLEQLKKIIEAITSELQSMKNETEKTKGMYEEISIMAREQISRQAEANKALVKANNQLNKLKQEGVSSSSEEFKLAEKIVELLNKEVEAQVEKLSIYEQTKETVLGNIQKEKDLYEARNKVQKEIQILKNYALESDKQRVVVLQKMLDLINQELGLQSQLNETTMSPEELKKQIQLIKDYAQEIKIGVDVSGKRKEIQDIADKISFLEKISQEEFKEEIATLTGEMNKLETELKDITSGMAGYKAALSSMKEELVSSIPYYDVISKGLEKISFVLTPMLNGINNVIESFSKTGAGKAIDKFLSNTGQTIKDFFDKQFGSGSENNIGAKLGELFKGIDDATGGILSEVGTVVSETLGPYLESTSNLFMVFGNVLMQATGWILDIVLASEQVSKALEYVNVAIKKIVAILGNGIVVIINTVIAPILGFVEMVVRFLNPVLMGIGQLVLRIMPIINTVGELFATMLNIFGTFIPYLLQITEIFGYVLYPILKAFASTLSAVAIIFEILAPVLDAFAFAVRVVATPIMVIASVFEWVGNIIHNFGTFVNNVLNNFFDSSKWNQNMLNSDLGSIINENLKKLWSNPETYEAFKPQDLNFSDMISSQELQDYINGWNAGLETGTFDVGQSISQAVVEKPPDVYIIVQIDGATVVDGLDTMRVVSVKDIIDAIKNSQDQKNGLNVVVKQK